MDLKGYTLFTLACLVHFPHNSMKKGRNWGKQTRFWARNLARNTIFHIKSVEKHCTENCKQMVFTTYSRQLNLKEVHKHRNGSLRENRKPDLGPKIQPEIQFCGHFVEEIVQSPGKPYVNIREVEVSRDGEIHILIEYSNFNENPKGH